MALRDNPYLPLYVQDFLTDEKLAECSAEATGVYIRLMCIMHKSEEYGKILLKQKDKQTDNQIKNFALKIAKHLPYSDEVITRSLTELIEEKVLTISEDTLFQKRMVKDSELSDKRISAGKKGGNPNLICLTKETSKEKNFDKPNLQPNAESDNENEYDIEIKEENRDIGGMGEKGKEETPNVENHCTEGDPCEVEVLDELGFENVWAMYQRKGNKKSSQRRWDGLPKKAKQLAVAHIPRYVEATPNLQYRKNFETYINQEAWNDTIISKNNGTQGITVTENGGTMGNGYSGNGAHTFRTDAENRRNERSVLVQMAETVLQQSKT